MAGSFEFFRKNQKSMLVAVAILAMLAFFVLPPILQMGGGQASADPVVAAWNGGEIREAKLSERWHCGRLRTGSSCRRQLPPGGIHHGCRPSQRGRNCWCGR